MNHRDVRCLSLPPLPGGQFAAAVPEAAGVFRIPRLPRATVDAEASAWGDTGFRIDVLPDKTGRLLPAEQFDPRVRLAWNEQGLLVLYTVRDSVLRESPAADALYTGDSFELFMARAPGATQFYQVTVAPGVDALYPEPRISFAGRHPPIPLGNLKIALARRKTPAGYVAEVLLPWSNLGLAGVKAGDRVAFQTMINDNGHGPLFNATWFPTADTSRNGNSFYTVELAETASAPEGLAAWGDYDAFRCTRFAAIAAAPAAGRAFTVEAAGQTLGRATLTNCHDRAEAEILLPFPPAGQPLPPLDLCLDGRRVRVLELPNADQMRARCFTAEDFIFQPFCFSGATFPVGDFAHPDVVTAAIGPYTLAYRYFDADGKPATVAEQPGRYAAVVEIAHGRGRVSKRFYTLYRLPGGYASPREVLRAVPGALTAPQSHTLRPLAACDAASELRATLKLPAAFELSDALLARHSQELDDFATLRVQAGLVREATGPILLAGLRDLGTADKVRGAHGALADSVRFAERQWWVRFKQQFYGTGRIFGRSLLPPQPTVEPPAPRLRVGSLAEAGMDPAFAAPFAELCEAWARESGVGFNVVVARHGIIVTNAGCGCWNGERVTPDTRCQLASTTKFLSACLMLQAVHQGLVRLDATVEQYLPAWRDVTVRRKMTVHELYDQTSGFAEHWSDELNDLEERTADYYPSLEIGVRVTYQGTGHALGSKILEYLTGKPLPAIFQDFLFGPLGCTASESEYSAAGAVSKAGDLAKVGQMMLNGGAYGPLRFCTPELVRALQSAPEKQRLGADKSLCWGMGIKMHDSDGLSDQAYGHTGATGAFLFVDPSRDLVVAMARNDEGKDYLEWRQKMFAAILQNVRVLVSGRTPPFPSASRSI